ncbi:MAG: D-glycerate dehydrogenase [Nitrospirae bacterium]|nr:D-glycerate dehydrogenase [Nitrospirota bacterium]
MPPKVFLTRTLPEPVMGRLREGFDLLCPSEDRALTKAEILAGVKDREALVSMLSDPIDAEVIAAAPALRIIANYAVGHNNVDLEAATARRIAVTNTPGVLTETTADLTWALILAVGRRLIEGDRLVREERWTGWTPTQLLGADIHGKTLGIIGMGRIGQAVARRAQGFGMRILYYSRTRLDVRVERELAAQFLTLHDLLAASDFVTVHTPLSPSTRHLLGTKEFARMKRTAFLINTSRGPVADEAALVEALESGQIAGAGLDVYENEPEVPERLRRLPQVVLLPHLGSASTETRIRMGEMALDNLRAFFEGRHPPNQVNRWE